jgi:hypothetical protein
MPGERYYAAGTVIPAGWIFMPREGRTQRGSVGSFDEARRALRLEGFNARGLHDFNLRGRPAA